MKLSIIIISYKTKNLLRNCLKSIFESKIDFPIEVIVVDNNSNDGSVEMVRKEFSSVRLIINKENLGYGKANNQGMKIAKGEYILLLNSDTEIINKAVSKMVKWLEETREVGVVGCRLLYKDGRTQQSAGYLPRLSKIFFWQTFLDDLPILKNLIKPYQVSDINFYEKEHEVGWITGAFFLLRKEIFEKTGGFDENIFMYTEEVEWCLRIKKLGRKIFFTPFTFIYHLKSASPRDISENGIISEYRNLIYLFKKHKPRWEMIFLPLILRLGAFLRILRFSIIGDSKKVKIYEKIFRVV